MITSTIRREDQRPAHDPPEVGIGQHLPVVVEVEAAVRPLDARADAADDRIDQEDTLEHEEGQDQPVGDGGSGGIPPLCGGR